MTRLPDHAEILRLSLYGNAAAIAKVIEGRDAAGWFVEADGVSVFRGRTTFPRWEAAAAFVEQLDRQFVAAGFQRLGRTEELPQAAPTSKARLW